LQFLMDLFWKDTQKARVLFPSGIYGKVAAPAEQFNVQEYLIEHYTK
jgi:hypothetical protein